MNPETLTKRSNFIFAFAWVLTAMAVASASAFAGDVRVNLASDYLDRIRLESGAPGVSAAVAVNGEIVFSGGSGIADLEAGLPQSGTVVHNVGSISKTIAVVGVMKLVEQGKVDLDDRIQEYAPWFPEKEQPITLRQLFTHTSGIGHYADMDLDRFPPEFMHKQYDDFEESTRYWRDRPLLFAPGEYWSYSSYATNLMHAIVEEASGDGFEEYLRENVWLPAGMLGTQFDVATRIVRNRGRGYQQDEDTGQFFKDSNENVSYKYAGGGIISTDRDLVRFGHALNSGKLLDAASIREMYRLQLDDDVGYTPEFIERQRENDPDATPPPPPHLWQALIWRHDTDSEGRHFIHHSGGVKGTVSHLRNYFQQDVVVAVHFNFNRGGKSASEATEALARLYLPPADEEK